MKIIRDNLKNLDQFIFVKLDSIKNSESYQKLQSFIAAFPESQQKLLYYLLGLSIILPPIIILLIFFINTSFERSSINVKKEILNEIQSFIYQKEQITQLSTKLTSPQAPSDQKSLQNALVATGVNATKLTIQNFSKDTPLSSSSISSLNATVSFKELSMEEMIKLFDTATSRYKMLIRSIKIIKNDQNQLVDGEFELRLFGKN